MICKKDVISWFKELESYKRIDTMCALLNMCLPFELRFLGTCLEELGRRDSQELRGIELRVNNPQDLAIDMAACQKGEPSDKKIRRKMALYLALIRACNRSCVTEIFKTLDGWGRRDFTKLNDSDTLQELLLVYTMAANHPVFTFEQHMTCAEIFERIKEYKSNFDYREQLRSATTPTEPHHMVLPHQQQHQTIHMQPGQHQPMQASIQMLPAGSITMSFPQAHFSKMIPADGSLQHPIPVDGIHMLSSNIPIPTEPNLPPTNAWSVRSNMQTYPPTPVEPHQPQSSSPMLSQQSSPSNSRTASPNRTSGNAFFQGQQQQQQTIQQVRNIQQRTGVPLRTVRRPSTEITPPPPMQQHQQLMGNMANDMIASQNIKNIDEAIVSNENSKTQLQALIRNGYARPGNHTIPRSSKSAINLQHHSQMQHQQQQQQQHQLQQQQLNQFQSLPSTNYGLAYNVHNMSLADTQQPQMENNMMAVMNQQKSGGSDSGSPIGSSGEISPPETPTLIGNSLKLSEQQQKQQQAAQKQQQLNYKQMNIARLNGRPDNLLPINAGGNTGTGAHIYPPATSPQQLYIGNDMILASGPNLLQSTLANNNSLNQVGSAGNDGGSAVVCSGGISANNNMGNTVLITSPSAINAGGGVISNVITSNLVISQPSQHQQNSAAHSYYAQHIPSTTRAPIISHSHAIAGPPPPFRLPVFQIPSNGEINYPYHTGIFLTPAPAAVAAVRSSTSTSVPPPTTTNVIQLPQPPPQQQQQSVLPQVQTNPPPPSAALPPYTSLTVGVSKQLSCYNCGSQTHNGRDCNEASMEDVTRGAIYKLDYSVSSSVSPTVSQSTGESNNSNCSSCNQQSMTTIEMGTESSSPTASTSSSSSLSNSNINPK